MYGLGLYCSGRKGLWYAAGLRGLWLWFWCWVPGEDALLDWIDVFPSSALSLALGLNAIPAWDGGSANDSTLDI